MKDLFCKQTIIQGDCLEKMREMQENSIDCILTDPPYGLSFMGKHWDKGIPGIEFWSEALRVCKPGATMLAFGGTRTYHRLACAIEDAGWQIRDCMMWLTGQGFPKSHNFGKQLGEDWEGFGTALKPAYEPILLCMKPLDGTFAQNADKWGLAGINVDECRIECDPWKSHYASGLAKNKFFSDGETPVIHKEPHSKGRWPSNLLFDEEAAEMLDAQSGNLGKSRGTQTGKNGSIFNYPQREYKEIGHNDSGGASRFFYCAKASPSDRGEYNKHPTVKPTKLLEYLLKLIMPPSQEAILLDPFMGSGSTLVAAKNLGFNAIGIEIEEEYCEISRNRVA